jgi:hypothetical protein
MKETCYVRLTWSSITYTCHEKKNFVVATFLDAPVLCGVLSTPIKKLNMKRNKEMHVNVNFCGEHKVL